MDATFRPSPALDIVYWGCLVSLPDPPLPVLPSLASVLHGLSQSRWPVPPLPPPSFRLWTGYIACTPVEAPSYHLTSSLFHTQCPGSAQPWTSCAQDSADPTLHYLPDTSLLKVPHPVPQHRNLKSHPLGTQPPSLDQVVCAPVQPQIT